MPHRPERFEVRQGGTRILWALIPLLTLLYLPQAQAAISKRMDGLIMTAARDCLSMNEGWLKQRYSDVQERKGEDGSIVRRYAVDQKTAIIFSQTQTESGCLVIGVPYDDTVQESLSKRRAMKNYEEIKTESDATGDFTKFKIPDQPSGTVWLVIGYSKEKDFVSVGYTREKGQEGSGSAGESSSKQTQNSPAPSQSPSGLLGQMRSGKGGKSAMQCWFSLDKPTLVIVLDKVVLLDGFPINKFEHEGDELAFQVYGLKYYFNFDERSGVKDTIGIREEAIFCE